ncbi:MAG TPA: hypothetical protein VHQ43_08605 [Solirubrobacterales bacterium]|nr:hypothetical protein [Solirubrobacterales bacterium]
MTRVLLVAAAAVLLAAGAAKALRVQIGEIIVTGDGGFTPTTLPKHENAPIKLYGSAKFETVDGSRPSPLRQLILEFDKHGAVETRGLEKCTMAKLVATTTKVARHNCPEAIVGKGYGTALIELPEQKGIKASSPLTLFNGPEKHGNPTLFGHAHIDYPGPTTYVISIEIEKIHNGRYGFRTVANFPRIVNDYGSPLSGHLTIGKTWEYKGKTLSFANAHCADGRLQAHAEFTFKNEDSGSATVFKPCKVRK